MRRIIIDGSVFLENREDFLRNSERNLNIRGRKREWFGCWLRIQLGIVSYCEENL